MSDSTGHHISPLPRQALRMQGRAPTLFHHVQCIQNAGSPDCLNCSKILLYMQHQCWGSNLAVESGPMDFVLCTPFCLHFTRKSNVSDCWVAAIQGDLSWNFLFSLSLDILFWHSKTFSSSSGWYAGRGFTSTSFT